MGIKKSHWLSKLRPNMPTTVSKKVNSLIQLLKAKKNRHKIIITPQLINEFGEVNDVLDNFCHPAFRQPIMDRQIILRTHPNFQAAGYAVLREDDLNKNFASTRKI